MATDSNCDEYINFFPSTLKKFNKGGKEWTTTFKPKTKCEYSESKVLHQNRSTLATNVFKSKNDETQRLRALANERQQEIDSNIKSKRVDVNNLLAKRKAEHFYKLRLKEREERKYDDLEDNALLYKYAFKHKCSHGYCNNMIKSAKFSGKIERYITCDHNNCRISKNVEDFKCHRCGYGMAHKSVNKECECESYICGRCKISNFVYFFDDKKIVQCYDKHVDGTISLTINGEVKTSYDIAHYLKNNIKSMRQTPAQHENFLRSLQGKDPMSYASLFKIKTFDSTVTIPEGGAVSTVKSATETLTTKVRDIFDEFVTKINSKIVKFMQDCIVDTVKVMIDSLWQTIKRIISIGLDFLLYCNIPALYTVLTEGGYLTILATLTSHFHIIKSAINGSKAQFKTYIYEGRKFPLSKQDRDMGILTTVLDSGITDLNKRNGGLLNREFLLRAIDQFDLFGGDSLEQLYNKLLNESKLNRFYDANDNFIQTLPESFDIPSLIKHWMPDCKLSFACVTKLCKEILPVLSTLRQATELPVAIKKLYNVIMEWIVPHTKDEDWFKQQLLTDGNPLNDLMLNLVALTESSITDDSYKKIREEYYTNKGKALAYLRQHNQLLNKCWLQFERTSAPILLETRLPDQREKSPLVIMIQGPPGTGKSTIWPLVAQKILKLKSLDEVSQVTYTWNNRSEYQVGLSNARVVLFDDFGQFRDKDGTDIQGFHELCTTAPYVINSPNIVGKEIKGMSTDPELIIVLTNSDINLLSETVTDKGSMVRRFHFAVKMLDKYDHQNPDKVIFKVEQNIYYNQLKEHEMSLGEFITYSCLTHHAYLKVHRDVNTILKELSKEDMQNIVSKPVKRNQINAISLEDAKSLHMDLMAMARDYNITFAESDGATTSIAATLMETENSKLDKLRFLCGRTIRRVQYVLSLFFDWSYVHVKRTLFQFVIGFVSGFSFMAGLLMASKLFSRSYSVKESGENKNKRYVQRISTYADKETIAEDGEDHIDEILENATGHIWCPSYNNRNLNCVFIGGHYIMLPLHFFMDIYTGSYIDAGTEIYLQKAGAYKPTIFKLDHNSIVLLKNNFAYPTDLFNVRDDVVLYRLDKNLFNLSRKITQFFWDGDLELRNASIKKIDYEFYKERFNHCYGQVVRDCVKTARESGKTYYYHFFAEASYKSRPASCGSLVKLVDGKVLGIHTARDLVGNSHFQLVCRKALEDAMIREPKVSFPSLIKIDLQNKPTYPEDSNLCFEGTLQKGFHAYSSPNSKIVPSLVNGITDYLYFYDSNKKTQPAILSHHDLRTPEHLKTYDSFSRHILSTFNADVKLMDEEICDRVFQSMQEGILSLQSKSIVKTKRLTEREVLNGIDGTPDRFPVAMDTSSGWPYIQRGKTKDKLLTRDESGNIVASRELLDDYYDALCKLELGEIPFLPGVLTLKDEKLKKNKIDNVKTRVFVNTNLVHYMVMKHYFGSIITQFYYAKIEDSFCYPSLDRYSQQWNHMMQYLTEVGEYGFDFDFTNWDRNVSAQMLRYAVDLLLTGIKVNDCEKEALTSMIVYPYLIYGDAVFSTVGTVSSGMLITFLVNCVVNEFLHQYAYLIVTSDHYHLNGLNVYKQFTRGMRAGDDTISLVDDRLLDMYNGITVSQVFENLGLKVTDSTKALSIADKKHVTNMFYLKCDIVKKGSFNYMPRPEYHSLIESMRWIRISKYAPDAFKNTEDNINAALRGLWFHGKNTYNDVRKLILYIQPSMKLLYYEDLSSMWNGYGSFIGTDYAGKEVQIDPFVDVTKIKMVDTLPQSDYGKQMTRHLEFRPHTPTEPIREKIWIETAEVLTLMEMDQEPIDSEQIASNMFFKTADLEQHKSQSYVDNNNVERFDINLDKTSDKNIGVTIQDASTTMTSALAPIVDITTKNDRATSFANDIAWTLSNLVEKWTLINTTEWKITDTVGTNILRLKIPEDCVVTFAGQSAFAITDLFRNRKTLFKVVIKAPQFYQGGLAIGCSPLFDNAPSLQRLVQMGAHIYDVAKDTSLEYEFPFRFHRGYYQLGTDEELGYFNIYVYSTLKTAADNINNVHVSTYVSFMDNEFKIPAIHNNSSMQKIFEKKTGKQRKRKELPNNNKDDWVLTIPEMSDSKQLKTHYVDINQSIKDMPKTMMCAGKGFLGKNSAGHFQDLAYDIVQMTKRMYRVENYTFTISSKRAFVLTMNYDDLYNAATYGQQLFNFSRGSINLHLMLRDPTRSIYGNIRFACPDTQPGVLQGLEGYQYFSYDQLGLITIPWISPQYLFARGNTLPLGTIVITLYNITNQDVSVGLALDACAGDDMVYAYFGGLDTPIFQPPKIVTFAVEAPLPYIPIVPAGIKKTIPEMDVLGGALNAFDDVVNTTKTTVDSIANAVKTTAPILQGISEFMELSATQITVNPAPIMQRTVPFKGASDNVTLTERLISLNHNGTTKFDKEYAGIKEKESWLYPMVQNIKSVYKTLNWTTNDPIGKVVMSERIGLNADPKTFLDFMAQPFVYWTGSINYIFKVFSTHFHTGQLMIAFRPNSVEDFSYEEATQTYFCIIDIANGQGMVNIGCPYISDIPYKNISKAGTAVPAQQQFSGLLKVFVQLPLRAPTSVVNNVDISVLVHAGPDFRMGLYNDSVALVRQTNNANLKLLTSTKFTAPLSKH